MTNSRTKVIAEICSRNLPLADAKLSDEYYYHSLPLCVVDAVFSIGVNYPSTQNTVERFCRFVQTKRLRTHGSDYPCQSLQLSISAFLRFLEGRDFQVLAESVFGNKQRTSSRGGILKAEAVCRFAQELAELGIEYFQDLAGADLERLESKITQIPGQKSLKSLNYFLMLSGDDSRASPGRQILDFLEIVTKKSYSPTEASEVLSEVVRILKPKYPHLTARSLDHEIWKYMKYELAA